MKLFIILYVNHLLYFITYAVFVIKNFNKYAINEKYRRDLSMCLRRLKNDP